MEAFTGLLWRLQVLVVALLLAVGGTHGAIDISGIDPQALAEVNPACITSGSNILTFCSNELSAAEEFFNISFGMPNEQILSEEDTAAFVATIDEVPPKCCKAACEFHNSFCACDETMVELITQLAGGDFKLFGAVTVVVGEKCEIPVYVEDGCIKKKKKQKKAPKGDCERFA